VSQDEQKEVRKEFADAVNMSPMELEDWLETEASQSVGWTRSGEDETIGHQSGRRIIEIQQTTVDELTSDDYAHMRKVIGYVHRHAAQPPDGEVRETRWRY
jgi:hypothetical protein